jgi:hypothetical protein
MMRSNYWSCTKFADWLRGTAKPRAETMEGWDEWRTTAKIRHNFRFWLAEEGLDYIQSAIYFIPDRIYAVKYYINNRWVSHTHALTAHSSLISKGQWCDVGHRFLPCLFSELVDFVEVELAWWHLVWEDKEKRKKYNAPWWRFGWWNMRLWRCPQAGLDNLAWQAGLVKDEQYTSKDDPNFGKPTEQAVKAKEILDLYTWWTEVYLKRPDPYEASGWSAYCDTSRSANGGSLSWSADKSPELRKMSDRALKALRKIEADYEKEDEQMMIRLIKVRHSLWT